MLLGGGGIDLGLLAGVRASCLTLARVAHSCSVPLSLAQDLSVEVSFLLELLYGSLEARLEAVELDDEHLV